MKAIMKKQSHKYQRRFGLVPDFKAGFHVGKVTAGEKGAIKKNVFSGDTLNTGTRTQSLCITEGVDILISGF